MLGEPKQAPLPACPCGVEALFCLDFTNISPKVDLLSQFLCGGLLRNLEINCKGGKKDNIICPYLLSNVISNDRQSFSLFMVLLKSTCLCVFCRAGQLQELLLLCNNLWLYTARPTSSLCT